jgi:uncharacterized protein (TIGR00730 family)
MKSLCVYCGSSSGSDPAFAQAAREVGEVLAHKKIRLIYGGGNVGLMGEVADACVAAGGTVIGVIPEKLRDLELAHPGLAKMHVVETMHERKALMADLADAFLALPGAIGTLEETAEAMVWTQLGYHAKPVGLLNVGGYYDHLVAFLEGMVAQQFLREEHLGMLLVGDDAGSLIDRLGSERPNYCPKWIDRLPRTAGRAPISSLGRRPLGDE